MTKKEGTVYGLTPKWSRFIPMQSASLQCESKSTCISIIKCGLQTSVKPVITIKIMATRSLPIFKNVLFFHKSELNTFQVLDLENETLVFPLETLDTSGSNEPPREGKVF